MFSAKIVQLLFPSFGLDNEPGNLRGSQKGHSEAFPFTAAHWSQKERRRKNEQAPSFLFTGSAFFSLSLLPSLDTIDPHSRAESNIKGLLLLFFL